MFVLVFAACRLTAEVGDYIAYWPFDGDNADSSLNGYDFAAGQGFEAEQAVAGMAAAFGHDVADTADTRLVDINDAPAIRDIGATCTISMWFRPKDLGGYYQERLLDYCHTATGDQCSLVVQWAEWNGRIDVTISENGTDVTVLRNTVYAAADDTWYHLAVVCDMDGNAATVDDVYIYLTPVTSASVNAPDVFGVSYSTLHNYSGPDDTCFLAIGASGDNPAQWPYLASSDTADDGWIDELAIYSRALSAAEIGELFDLGRNAQGLPVLDTCPAIWDAGLGQPTDLNRDCRVDGDDITVLQQQWMQCNDPQRSGCMEW